MKRFCLILLVLLSVFQVNGQTNKKKEFLPFPTGYEEAKKVCLDTVFYKGMAINKKHSFSYGFFNYNILYNSIVFISDNKMLTLNNINDLIQISYGDRTFIPLKSSKVAEVIKTFSNGMSLLKERITIYKSGAVGAYEINTETSSTTRISHLDDWGKYAKFELKDNCEYHYKYYLLIEGNIKQLNNIKKIKKIFPGKEQLIEEEAKKYSIENIEERYINIISACVANQ